MQRRGEWPTAGALIRLENVSVSVGSTPILSDVSLGIAGGGPIVLMGPNGAGKTTLLKVAMGLLAPSTGQVSAGMAAPNVGLRKAFVFQRPAMLRRSVAGNVAFALKAAGLPATSERVLGLLDQAGLAGLAARPARRLSGGEQQRLALARALARQPDVLFLDEPTASLDPAATRSVEAIVSKIVASGVTVVMATHDLGQARRLGETVVFLVRGRVLEQTDTARFFANPETQEARRFLAGDLVL